MFSRLSWSSISFATVTPSLVIVGDPNFFSMTTFRPLGPRVTFTASARKFTPRKIACRDSSPCTICFANDSFSLNVVMLLTPPFTLRGGSQRLLRPRNRDCTMQETRRQRFLLPSTDDVVSADAFFLGRTHNDAQNFFLFHDEEILSIKFDFGSGVLAEQNTVAFFYSEWEQLAFLVGLALPHRDDSALLGFIFG